MDFIQAIQRLNEIGSLDVALPFLLIFTLIFAALQKTKILGSKDARTPDEQSGKRYNIVIALVIALLIVIPHVVYNDGDLTNGKLGGALIGMPDVVEIINNSLPSISVWIVGILMLLLILGLFGAKFGVLETPISTWITGGAVILVAYIFAASAGYLKKLPGPLSVLHDPANQAALIIILVFAIIVWFVVREPSTPSTEKSPFEKSLDKFWGGSQ
ncbi:hypothetical protein KY325_04465 [Candidatus Woesearchaeota archaeon]|nr:hypothetical protein [Candidatus Woesearchaeota archaeon]MBW3018388.1 hypothetical protein [Candidatus Woesearchaeota archaeon]